MFTDLAAIRQDVKDRLTPILPPEWRTEATLEGTVKAVVPVLYIEFVRIAGTVQGQDLSRDQVGAYFNIIITDPKTDTDKAEDAVDAHVLKVLTALDSYSDMYWESAEKKRFPDGPLAWTFSVFAFASTQPPAAED